MRAMILRGTSALDDASTPLELVDVPIPTPRFGEVLIRVAACGVCHTELDEIEGRVVPPHLPVILGHEVVGRVQQLGSGTSRLRVGDRVGVGWIHSSSGEQNENLSSEFRATGRDVNGGYAEYITVPELYAYRLPDGLANFPDPQVAPLLCAGAVGYRALRLTELRDGQALGLMGFGASGHLVLPMARRLFPHSRVHVFARDAAARQLAVELGAAWAGGVDEHPPEPLRAIIDTTPVWGPVLASLRNLAPGGRLVINTIRKEDVDKHQLLTLSYHEHLWMEREIKTVANVTGVDIQQLLELAAEIPLRPMITTYPLERANDALRELKRGGTPGAKVLTIN